jgi:phage gp16-like protein
MTEQLRKTIFVGCRQLGLDTETRRDLQLVATGKASMSDMSVSELNSVLAALKKRGFEPGFKAASKGRFKKAAPRADLRYVHVLWGMLGKAGKLKKKGRDGLNAFVRSRFESKWKSVPIDIDALRDADQINDVTRALKDWCKREGIATERTSKK